MHGDDLLVDPVCALWLGLAVLEPSLLVGASLLGLC